MSFETILVETVDKVCTISLNRPDKLNAISPTLLAELKTALDDAGSNEDISVVVIKGEGRAFCVGYDLSEKDWIISQFPADFPDGVDIDQDHKDIIGLLDYWLDMWKFAKPTIAQVHGPCLSGAGEMLAVCDLVIASDDASFGHPAGRDLGIPPTVFFWPLLIGMRKTKELLYTAKSINAATAEKLGLINTMVPRADLDNHVQALARDIAKTPVNLLEILKSSANNFYDNMNIEKSTKQAAELDAIFHQSPTFQAFFTIVRERGMKAALEERKRLFG